MSTPNSNDNNGKSITNLKDEVVKGESILGGGKDSGYIPSFEDDAAGLNNSAFAKPFDGVVGGTESPDKEGGPVTTDDGFVKGS